MTAPPLSRGRLGGGGLVVAVHHPQQHRFGTDLQENVDALLMQRGDPVGKTDRFAHMAHPVVCCGNFSPGHFAREIGNQPHVGLVVGNALGNLAELRQHWLH